MTSMEWEIVLKGATYAGLGGLTLFIVGWSLVAMVKRNAKRSESEGDLDKRTIGVVDMLQEIVQEERGEKKRAQDERDKVVQQFIQYSTETHKAHSDEVKKLREEHAESMRRTHERLDESEKRDARCQAELLGALRRVEKLEHLEAARAITPGATVNVTTTPMPAVAVAQ